jgi:hypothetical protein
MFKFVVLSCFVSVAFGGIIHAPAHIASYAVEKTIIEPHSSIIETPTVEHVATKITSVPSATSYQSQTQYHSKTLAEPIYAHGVQKTIVNTPVVKEYVENVPAVVPVAKAVYAEPFYAKTIVQAPVKYISEPVYAKTIVQPAAYAYPQTYASSYSLPLASYAHAW